MVSEAFRDLSTEEIDLHLPADELRLEEEWIKQPALRRKWGVELAQAEREVALAKADLAVVEADTEDMVRKNPDDYCSGKVTESAVKAAVTTHPMAKKAKQRLIDAQYAVAVLNAAVAAVDHRKKALEKLVDLFLSDYWSVPKAPRAAREDLERVTKEAVRVRGRDRYIKPEWDEKTDDRDT